MCFGSPDIPDVPPPTPQIKVSDQTAETAQRVRSPRDVEARKRLAARLGASQLRIPLFDPSTSDRRTPQ